MSDGGGGAAGHTGGAGDGLLAGLTPAQRRAATHVEGPMLVVAGPGAGKTRTLTARLGHLLAAGHARPDELLAVTFTRKAAAEMRGRLGAILGPGADGVRVGTFHSVACALRPPPGRVLAEGDRLAILRRAAEGAGVGARALQEALCRMKAQPDAPITEGAAGEHAAALAHGVAAYEALRRALGAEDLDDLLLGALAALRSGAAPPWRYVCIDEYQDTNGVQRALARALGGAASNVFAIGDPDQAIYAFRGAGVGNFYAFPADFPGAQVVDLADNFRSTATIVGAAAAVIAGNPRPDRAAARPDRGPGALVEHIEAATDLGEGERIAAEIEKLLGGTSLTSYDTGRAASHDGSAYSFSDVAVLARTGARADALAAALSRAGLPVQRPRRSLLEREEARDLLAYLRLAADAGDGGALLRVLLREARAALPALDQDRPGADGPAAAIDRLDEATRRAIEARRAALSALSLPARIDAAAALLETPEDVRAAAQALGERLGEGALLSEDPAAHESDELDPRAERVSVLTMHGAKGLEFPVVFVAGCEAALLPGAGCSPAELEEERRLFYVALTRARDRLYVSWARRGARGEAQPSPFLREIPESLRAAARVAAPRKRAGQMKLF